MSDVPALSALLAAEYATCYGLSAGGGQLAGRGGPPGAVTATRAAFDDHRLRRDRLIAALVAAKAAVPPPAAAYAVPRFADARAALTFLATLADRTIRVYRAELAGLAGAAARRDAVSAVVADAVYAAQMRSSAGLDLAAASSALPGS